MTLPPAVFPRGRVQDFEGGCGFRADNGIGVARALFEDGSDPIGLADANLSKVLGGGAAGGIGFVFEDRNQGGDGRLSIRPEAGEPLLRETVDGHMGESFGDVRDERFRDGS